MNPPAPTPSNHSRFPSIDVPSSSSLQVLGENLFLHSPDSESEDSFPLLKHSSRVISPPTEVDTTVLDLLNKLKDKKQYSLLYRSSANGKLLQVVRRKDFAPLKIREMEKTRLMTSDVGSQKVLAETHEDSGINTLQKNATCRYPYWNFADIQRISEPFWNRSNLNFGKRKNQTLSSTFSHEKPRQQSIVVAPKINTEAVPQSPKATFPHPKVRKIVPKSEFLAQTQQDLGLEDASEDFRARFLQYAKARQTGNSEAIRSLGKSRKLRLQRSADRDEKERKMEEEELGSVPEEEYGRAKLLKDQAKALFSEGAFSQYYRAERIKADSDLKRFLRYAN